MKKMLGILPVHDSEEMCYPLLEHLLSYLCLPSMSAMNILFFSFGKFFVTH